MLSNRAIASSSACERRGSVLRTPLADLTLRFLVVGLFLAFNRIKVSRRNPFFGDVAGTDDFMLHARFFIGRALTGFLPARAAAIGPTARSAARATGSRCT